MTCKSIFPNPEYETFKSYFAFRYGIQISNEETPLIETQILDVNNINYLTPQ